MPSLYPLTEGGGVSEAWRALGERGEQWKLKAC